MMQLEQIKNFFPVNLRSSKVLEPYILKEYLQLTILNFLSTTSYIRKISFIGGTNLRLVKGIDRFSEDLDFDCKQLSEAKFEQLSADVLGFLQKMGLQAELKAPSNDKLKAFRRSICFPQLLFSLGLSGHKEQRFLIKLEAQDQKFDYEPVFVPIKGCGLFFHFPVPSDDILCAMKISALLSRHKGRDFYDAMFLLGQCQPNYEYLAAKCKISNVKELKHRLLKMTEEVNLEQKSKDFEHLLFRQENAKQILKFRDFVTEAVC